MKEERIRGILTSIESVTVAVYGDFCLDAYWLLDPNGSEVSVETGLRGRAVAEHYYTLGGAANVAANLAALRPASIAAIGAIGDDIFGRELRRRLADRGVDTERLVVQDADFDTVTFAKPCLEGAEQNRVDFGFRNRRSVETDRMLLDGMRSAMETADVLIVNQQVPGSIPDDAFFAQADALFAAFPDTVVLLDTRHYGDRFMNVCLKTNDVEAAVLNGGQAAPGDVIALDDLRRCGSDLFKKFGRPVFITRGSRGIVTVDAGGVYEMPGIQLLGTLDPVGAGDTVTGAIALCLGAGVPPREAAAFANIAAAVTVQKLYRTGTASGEEILAAGRDPDYLYRPELAEDIRQARYIANTGIEICAPPPPAGRIRHAVFDHDGTISTLRQGWEEVMAPVMIRAVLGDRYRSAGETLYHKVRARVREYIDRSTGIQTVLQMRALVAMVREFGVVPAGAVLDEFGYKRLYDEALGKLVDDRLEKLGRGLLDVADFTVKGAVAVLADLADRGVTLYLASGTDREAVVAEAGALGYADLFDGGIYGALGDVAAYSKKMVIERIIGENDLRGPELAVFGDGPVEIREARKHDGVAVGIASDEIRRHGLNPEKRTRLVKAGAHRVVPDFSERAALIDLLMEGA